MAIVSVDPAAALEALEKTLSSSTFESAARSSALLRFVVEETVNGRADRLKEYTLGREALGRGEHFDPRTDPIVRAEASRLRSRLERYYATDGRTDSVVIVLPKGSYVPQFESRVLPAAGFESGGGMSPLASLSSRRQIAWVALGIALGAAAMALWRPQRTPPLLDHPVIRFEAELSANGSIGSEVGTDVLISPDGSRVLFASLGSDGVTRLYTRRLDQAAVAELPGTEGARSAFFSPDGQWVGFGVSGTLRKTAIGGGSPVVLCQVGDFLGASWGDDGNIYFAPSFGTLARVPSSSGTPTVVADLRRESLDPRWPQVLPGSKFVLFTAVGPEGPNGATIQALSLATGKRTIVARGGTFGRYLDGGFLTYVNQGTLFALPLNLERIATIAATPVPIIDDVMSSAAFGFAQIDVSRTGTLVYRRSAARGQLIAATIDRSGGAEPLLPTPAPYTFPSLAPDGQRIAVSVVENGAPALWIHGPQSNRTAWAAVAAEYGPTWTRDGRFLVLGGIGGLQWLRVDAAGAPQRLLPGSTHVQVPWSFSPDGSRLAFHESRPATGFDLWTVPVHVNGSRLTAGEPELFLGTAALETYPTFSPDGHWIAYGSGAYGKWEVYVRPFPNNGAPPVQVSRGGGRIPRWLPNRRELVYRTDDQRLMLAAYEARDGVFVAGEPHAWSSRQLADTGVLSNFDIARDPSRIIGLIPARNGDEQRPNHVTVELNFADDLRQRVARVR
jgi:Tol biopolymer transport system component